MTTTDSMMSTDKKCQELQTFEIQKPVDNFTASEMYVKQVLARILQGKDSEPNDETYLF
jgi:hypothetical protein